MTGLPGAGGVGGDADRVEVAVRALRGEDRAAWQRLWASYLDFYGETVPDEVTNVVFHRLVDDGWPLQFGLVAGVDGVVVGIANCGLQHSTWAVDVDCYLEDLFVDPSARGAGVGAALLAHLVEEGRDRGWRTLHWLTDRDNETARRLYERTGTLEDQVRYTIDLTEA